MDYHSLQRKIIGVTPLIHHNGQLADPLNKFARALKSISAKRDKTDADHAEMARQEWYGGLYLSEGVPCLPAEMIEAALIESAKKQKRGKQAQAGIRCPQNVPLIYDGPKDQQELWEDEQFRLVKIVRVQRNRVLRCRPIFRQWAANLDIEYDPHQLNEREMLAILIRLGDDIGLGDWRPKYGRFQVEPQD